MLTVIIPTRNRPDDLLAAVQSISLQTRLPDELILVDQSVDSLSKVAVKNVFRNFEKVKLNYIHDPKILGLVDAKRVGVNRASGDIICFLEDDVILESDYLQQIELGFISNPNMIGCSGVITNPPKINFLYKFLFVIFHRGIFKDNRINFHGNYCEHFNNLIESDMLSGGVSAWRREVFDKVEFDVTNGFHMFEDIDFSTRAARHYPNRLFINLNARLAHYCSQLNRDAVGAKERRKLTECFAYYKKRKDWPNATISFNWLLLGILFESIFQAFSNMSFKPIQGYFLGVRDGFAKKIIS